MSDQLPTAVSESTLVIGDATLRVAQLDNGQRCIDADDVQKFLAGGGDAWQLADVWQTDTEQELARVTAERAKLWTVLEAVQKVTGKYGAQMSDLFGQDEEFNDVFDMVDAVLAELKQQ